MLNLIEEAKFAELKAMCRELKVLAPPEVMISLKMHDKNGILIFDDIQRGHSWTRNLWNGLFFTTTCANWTAEYFGAGYMSYKEIGGGLGPFSWVGFFEDGAVGSDAAGIRVGMDDTAFDINQFALINPINEGVGANQFSHQAGTKIDATYNAGTKIWSVSHSRIMNNNSGGTVTVKEVGAYTAPYYSHMLERSVLITPVSVANGAQLTVTYELSMDFSAID